MRKSAGVAAATLAALAVAASACTSAVRGHGTALVVSAPSLSSSPPSSPASSAPAIGGSNAALSASQLEQATKHAWLSATSWKMTGSGQDGGTALELTMHFGLTSTDGTLGIDGVTVALRYVAPDLYMKGGEAFWRKAGGLGNTAADQRALGLLVGRWVHIPAGTPGLSELGSIAIRTEFIAKMGTNTDSSAYKRGPSKTLNGVPAVSFVDPSDGSTIYVPASGTPYPIRIEGHGTTPGTFTLTAWNEPYAAPRPPADQIFELPH